MPKRTNIVPGAPLARILMNLGAKRVSQSAITAFVEELEERGNKIAAKAVQIAKHSGRKTVQAGDIKIQ